jgi:hypothetical protein
MGQDRWATNLGMLLGLSPVASWIALAAIEAPIGWMLARHSLGDAGLIAETRDRA